MFIKGFIKKARTKSIGQGLGLIAFAMGLLFGKQVHHPGWRHQISVTPHDHHLLQESIQQYCRDHHRDRLNSPEWITPQQLAEQGYLHMDSAQRWNSMKLKLRLPIQNEDTGPVEHVLAEATSPGGDKLYLMTDGSIQNSF